MILIVSNSKDVTADYLCIRLRKMRLPVLRLDTDTLTRFLKIEYDGAVQFVRRGRPLSPEAITGVWLRRPEPIVCGARSPDTDHEGEEWAEALEGFLGRIPDRRWINHPTANARASHKMDQLIRAKELGLRIPRTIITQNPRHLRRFFSACDGRVIAKPLSSGYIEREPPHRDAVIYTSRVRGSQLRRKGLLARCPTLFQEEVIKSTDARVCFIDGRPIAVALDGKDSQGRQTTDIRRDNMADVKYRQIRVPAEIGRLTAKLIRSYSLRFAAVDYAIDEAGRWYFLEINPNGQWAWLDLQAGTKIGEALIRALHHG